MVAISDASSKSVKYELQHLKQLLGKSEFTNHKL